MQQLAKLLAFALTAVVALAALDPAAARPRKQRLKSDSAAVARDYDGTPIIMQGFRRTRPVQDQPRQSDRAIRVPRGSGAYVPPPVPSPGEGPPARALVRPAAAPYQPPPVNSFSDRVINCIHSYPLNAGIGNNPADRQSYVRQCAN
jgi:hypothetical protein